MGKVAIRKFSYLDHHSEIIRERRNFPPISTFEPRLGIQVRYGLKFDGHITHWTNFVEAADDQLSAESIAEMGVRQALELYEKTERASSAA
ncbi:hypothetical protein [Deinococcus humi]|uniref:Uncharacterized protein n=1 Tax=Deinococcus humi TaxID=662880 RepID=A0A7W8NHW3_9DEIO|nr:hypothetical protein [Deinococcus humi]MBB5365203.1 hypothetical protein [Deinococcus humi]GGO35601.1 hypothetical protein GCM10008949_38320 [Deinococcus humi]